MIIFFRELSEEYEDMDCQADEQDMFTKASEEGIRLNPLENDSQYLLDIK